MVWKVREKSDLRSLCWSRDNIREQTIVVRMSTDLETWNAWKNQGIGNRPLKFREFAQKSRSLPQHAKSQGKVREFCSVRVIFSQFEDSNFENFLREYAPRPPTWFRTHMKVKSWSGKSGRCQGGVREKSGNSIPSGKWKPWVVFCDYCFFYCCNPALLVAYSRVAKCHFIKKCKFILSSVVLLFLGRFEETYLGYISFF